MVRVGEEHYGVLIKVDDMGQGFIENYIYLITSYNNETKTFLSIKTFGPGVGTGACSDTEVKEHQKIDIKFIENSRKSYFDIEALVKWNKGRCGQVQAIKEVRHYEFRNGKYFQTEK